jgi:hypothetical protein
MAVCGGLWRDDMPPMQSTLASDHAAALPPDRPRTAASTSSRRKIQRRPSLRPGSSPRRAYSRTVDSGRCSSSATPRPSRTSSRVSGGRFGIGARAFIGWSQRGGSLRVLTTSPRNRHTTWEARALPARHRRNRAPDEMRAQPRHRLVELRGSPVLHRWCATPRPGGNLIPCDAVPSVRPAGAAGQARTPGQGCLAVGDIARNSLTVRRGYEILA